MNHVLDSVEDERAFSSLTFLKDRLKNRLDNHLFRHSWHARTTSVQSQDPSHMTITSSKLQWVSSLEKHRYGAKTLVLANYTPSPSTIGIPLFSLCVLI